MPESLADVSPNRSSYTAAIRALDAMPADQRPAHVEALTQAVEDWPAHTRSFAFRTQRGTLSANPGLLQCIGRVELAVISKADASLAIRVLSALPWRDLQHVHLRLFPGAPVDIVAIVEALPPSVDGLTLGGTGAQFDTAALLQHPRWLSMRHLGVDGMLGEPMRELLLAAERLPQLETLWLPCGAWNPTEVAALVERPELRDLERLAFRCFLPEDDGGHRLADALAGLERLHTVALERYWMSVPGHPWVSVPEPLPSLLSRSSVHELHYTGGATTSTRLRELLSTSQSLSTMSLHGDVLVNDLGWVEAPALAQLEALAVTASPRIGDDAARHLATAGASNLRHLDLRNNDVGAEGARALVGALEQRLEVLDLSGNPIGDTAVDALVAHPFLLERVVSLNLERCELGAASVGRLLDAVTSRAARVAVVRVAAGNEIDAACADQLGELRRRGVSIDALHNAPVAAHAADPPRRYRPVHGAGREGAEARAIRAWESIDASLVSLADRLDEPPLFPAARDEVDAAVAALHARWAELGLRVPASLSASWQRYSGDDGLLFEVLEGEPRSWYGPGRAREELLSMLDIDVGWQVSWLPIAEDGVYLDVRTGEVRRWDRGEDWGLDLDWPGLLEAVAASLRGNGD